MKISALILTKNEQGMIENCLKQLTFADEIIVLDQNSTDQTVKIAKKYTDKIFYSDCQNFDVNRNQLKNFAHSDWLLYVDADERLSQDLIDEIKEVINQDRSAFLGPHPAKRGRTAECSAFYFPRENYILGKWVKHGGWWPDYTPRLFRKNKLIKWQGRVHESPQIQGDFGYFKHAIKHLSGRNLSQMFSKSIKWAKIEAQLLDEAGHTQVNILSIVKSTLLEFIRRFFIKAGFMDGIVGLIEAIYQAYHQAMVIIYLWEIQNTSNKKFKKA